MARNIQGQFAITGRHWTQDETNSVASDLIRWRQHPVFFQWEQEN